MQAACYILVGRNIKKRTGVSLRELIEEVSPSWRLLLLFVARSLLISTNTSTGIINKGLMNTDVLVLITLLLWYPCFNHYSSIQDSLPTTKRYQLGPNSSKRCERPIPAVRRERSATQRRKIRKERRIGNRETISIIWNQVHTDDGTIWMCIYEYTLRWVFALMSYVCLYVCVGVGVCVRACACFSSSSLMLFVFIRAIAQQAQQKDTVVQSMASFRNTVSRHDIPNGMYRVNDNTQTILNVSDSIYRSTIKLGSPEVG